MSVDLKDSRNSMSSKYSENSSTDLSCETSVNLNSPISITVTNSEIWEKNKKFTVYKLLINCGEKSWKIYRRYNEFNTLNEQLRKQIPGFNLKLPGKKLFGNNFSAEFIRNRKQGLDNFVQRLVSEAKLMQHPEVQTFFHLDSCKVKKPANDNNNNITNNNKNTVDKDNKCKNGSNDSSTICSGSSGSGSDRDDSVSMDSQWTVDTNSSNGSVIKEIVNLGPSERLSSKPNDFEFLKVIGKGSFGKVLLAKLRSDSKIYAVKVLQKKMIIKRNEKNHIMCERNVLLKNLNHPFLVGLHYSFQTRDKLYFVLDYVNGGELFFHLQRETYFNEPRARFYAAEITSALSYLHSEGIVYRDLKPENILLDSDGHIVLTDFGLCKEGLRERETTSTFCGTPEYLAPEVLRKECYDKCVDWWCLGAVLYEMLYGLPPFYSRDTAEMYDNILHKPVRLRTNISLAARNLLECLLEKDKHKRLGAKNDANEIKGHDFFKPINWSDLESKSISPPFNPNVKGCLDLKNIDPEFTREPIPASVCRSNGLSVSSIPENAFQGFSYAASVQMVMR